MWSMTMKQFLKEKQKDSKETSNQIPKDQAMNSETNHKVFVPIREKIPAGKEQDHHSLLKHIEKELLIRRGFPEA